VKEPGLLPPLRLQTPSLTPLRRPAHRRRPQHPDEARCIRPLPDPNVQMLVSEMALPPGGRDGKAKRGFFATPEDNYGNLAQYYDIPTISFRCVASHGPSFQPPQAASYLRESGVPGACLAAQRCDVPRPACMCVSWAEKPRTCAFAGP
jgi:hypothetical protein